MNKKVSTIFAMAALMGGVFSGSAYAEQISSLTDGTPSATEFTAQKLFLQIGGDYVGAEWVDETTQEEIKYLKASSSTNIEKDDLAKYLWTVSQTALPGSKFAYAFTNVETGESIRVEVASGSYTVLTEDPADDDAVVENLFEITGGAKWDGSNGKTFTLAGYTANDVQFSFEMRLR